MNSIFFGWTPMVGWFAYWAYCHLVTFHRVYHEFTYWEGNPLWKLFQVSSDLKPRFSVVLWDWNDKVMHFNGAILISNSESKSLDTFCHLHLPSNLKMAGMTIGMWPVQTSSARLMSILLFSWPSMRRCIICDIHWCQWNSLVLSPRIGLAISNGMFGIPNFTMEAYELTEGNLFWMVPKTREHGDRLFWRLPKCYTATVPPLESQGSFRRSKLKMASAGCICPLWSGPCRLFGGCQNLPT